MEQIGFCSECVPAGIQKLWPSFQSLHEERKMMVGDMQLQTVL